MAWIESHQELARHPKTKKLARLLGESVRNVTGLLHFLWWWAMDYAQDGDLSRYTVDDIADAVEWEKGATELIDALCEAGFLDKEGDVLHIHDWYEYAGRLIDKRKENAERMRTKRAEKKQKSAPNVQRTSNARTGATRPDQTEPDQTIPNQPDQTEPFAALDEIAAANSDNENMSSSFTLDHEFGQAVQIFENDGFGRISEIVGEQIAAILDEFGFTWYKLAVTEAVKSNRRTLKYVAGILRNWRAEGGPKDGSERGNARAPNKQPARDERYSAFYDLFPDG